MLIVEKLFVRLFIMPFSSSNWKVNQFCTFKIEKLFLNMLFRVYNLITKRITRSLYSSYKLLVILFAKKLFLLRKEIDFVYFSVLCSLSVGTIRFHFFEEVEISLVVMSP